VSEWYQVDELRKSETIEKRRFDSGEIDFKHDFASYRGLVNGKSMEEVKIQSHNAVGVGAEV